jgi:hypothetical protein
MSRSNSCKWFTPGLMASAACAALAAGCAPAGEEIGAAREAALSPNALSPNALSPNALSPNALSPNALSPNALSPDALSPGALGSIEAPDSTGDLARELLLYTVSCAFDVDQSFDFSWTDASGAAHAESYPGLNGLAPNWAAQPLDPTGQQWVSDCLGARVNAEGVSVMLSIRGTSPALAASTAELEAYQTREGAFFGNLFNAPFKVYACYDPLSMVASVMAKRVCAQPFVAAPGSSTLTYDCGPIQVLGPCEQVVGQIAVGPCFAQDPVERYFYDCAAPCSSAGVESITTFLQGSIPL